MGPTSKFCPECGARSNVIELASPPRRDLDAGASKQPPENGSISPSPPEGELRQLTVMFCDLVGSTALSADLDPESWQAVLGSYHATCHQAIVTFDGYLAQYLGDGVLAYFGFPTSHEDDAVRAIQSGLAILEGLRVIRLSDGRQIQARIGIHTGPVMVTGIGAGARKEMLAVGETPNLAARLQSHAAPDSLVMSGSTARLVAGRYDLTLREPKTFSGFSVPTEVFEIERSDGPRSAFEAAVSRGLTPVVGREHETGLVLDKAASARDGLGQVVLVLGEPGIGKSRLALSVKERAGVRCVEYRCSTHFQHTALYPIVRFFEHALGFERRELPYERLARIETMVATLRLSDEAAVALLAALLSLPESAGYCLPSLSPAVQRQRTLALLLEAVLNEAAREPICLLFEDLHWADPTTLEFLLQLIEQTATVPLLLLATARPEFKAQWPARAHVSMLSLGRLSPGQVVTMVEKVSGGKSLPPSVVQQILLKTDGIPLFVEELTKMILESGQLHEVAGAYVLSGSLPTLRIPDTLQDSLQARLDRLQGAREIAQYGAVLGREFSHELLRAVSGLDDVALETGLKQLLDAELIYARGRPPSVTYQFKHALVQDAAYQSLLKRKRQEYHARVAARLLEKLPDLQDLQPELIAHHLTEGGQTFEALPFWLRAGHKGAERSANVEAIAHLKAGLALIDAGPNGESSSQQELSFLMALAPALMATKGYAHAEVDVVYKRVRTLAHELKEPLERFRLLYGLWLYYANIPRWDTALELTDSLLTEASAYGDPERTMLSEQTRGVTAGWMGDFADARRRLEKAAALYDHDRHHQLTFHYGSLNPGTFALLHAGIACWHLGLPNRALAHCNNSLEWAKKQGHPISLAQALVGTAWINYMCGNDMEAGQFARDGRSVAVANDSAFWIAWADLSLGGYEKNPDLVRQGITELTATGARLGSPMHLQLLAQVLLYCGAYPESLVAIEEGIVACADGEEIALAELYRLRGEAYLAQGKAFEEVSAEFEKSLDVARRQNAKSWELRTTVSLARLLSSNGRVEEAYTRLFAVYDWFTEGFDTKDLQVAKELLDKLSSDRLKAS